MGIRIMDEKQNIKEAKRNIRKQILSVRNEMPIKLREEKSAIILKILYGTEQFKEADIILVYADYQSEVITTPLFTEALMAEKQIFAPRVSGEEMEFYRISNKEGMKEGYKGIREPVSDLSFIERIDALRAQGRACSLLMLMPGVAFDKERHRIGYGKGFYDRYLKQPMQENIKVYTIALCYECQLLDKIPYEIHDIMPNMIITENGIYE